MCDECVRNRLASRVDEILYGAKWTHKIHEKQADIYELIGKSLSLVSLATMAASGSGAIATIIVDAYALKCFVAALSAASLFCSLWSKTFSFEERAASQRAAAKTFLSIREHSRDLELQIALGQLDADEALAAINELVEHYLEACGAAPSTTGLAVRRAEKASLDEGKTL